MRPQLNLYMLAVSFLLVLALNTPAAGQTYTTIDYPGSVATLAVGINDARQIVGRYTDTAGIIHGFLLSNGSYSSFDVPGSTGFTRALGINSEGQIVGDYNVKNVQHGFLLSSGTFTTIDPPGAHGTFAEGINSNGDIVGTYFTNTTNGGLNPSHGFLLQGGVFTAINFPDAVHTEAWRTNDAGEILGRYQSSDGKHHIYVLSNGNFTAIPDVSDTARTEVFEVGGFSGNGDISASYCNSTPCGLATSGDLHGFLLKNGAFTTFDFPGAAVTAAFGLNSFDDITGTYTDSSGKFHGYLRTP